jgi:hypothetical protein
MIVYDHFRRFRQLALEDAPERLGVQAMLKNNFCHLKLVIFGEFKLKEYYFAYHY